MRSSSATRDQEIRPSPPFAGRLGLRILVGFLLVALVPLVASTLLGYQRSYRIVEEVTEGSVGAVSEVGVLHVRNRMDRHFLSLHAIAAGNEFLGGAIRHAAGDTAGALAQEATPEVVGEYLTRQWASDEGYFSNLFLVSRDGELIAATGRLEVDVSALPRITDRHRVITVPGPSVGGAPSFLLMEPVTLLRGDVVGALGGLVRSTRANEFFQIAPQIAGSIETYILDADGRPLFASHNPAGLDYSRPLATPLLGMTESNRARYLDRDGLEVIGIRSPVPGYEWIQITEIPVEAALESLRRLRRAAILLTLAFTLLVATAAWLMSAQIVAPVRVLVGAVRRLGGGDLAARVDLDQRDEIGELATAFNNMAERLEETSARADALHQREIERAQQLATVGELASGLAHEIKNPMVAISNGLDLVQRRLGPDQDLDPILAEVGRETDRVQATIRDLLTFARPSSPQSRPCDPNEVLERALHLTRASASVSGLRMEIDLDPSLPRVMADPDQMRQALVNLILNAIQASPASGTIEVRSRVVEEGEGGSPESGAPEGSPSGQGRPSEEGRGRFVRLEIADRGPGVPEADRHLVFKPFYTTKHTGTGLGLSITRGIVERHGGTLELVGREGGGAIAAITLPVSPGPGAGVASHIVKAEP